MNRKIILNTIMILTVLSSCIDSEKYQVKKITDANGYSYETVTNDPMGVRIYTLENGLTVYLSANTDEPRIQTFIAVKAGSSYDPSETTGLAHYFEHLMFKGTNKIGTLDWEKEKVLLDQIAQLYEKHRATNNEDEKAAIYAQIDSVSSIAANYCVPSEYDKLLGIMGAKGTNAYTGNEKTVYLNDIPKNELKRWLEVEKERFENMVVRLFHTELETVYEEFNMGQNNDGRKIYRTVFQTMFPDHPYGTQTTLGTPEHLRNPSILNIQNFKEKYYVPNNMAICLSGDIDFEQTIKLIDQTFGRLKKSDVPKLNLPESAPLTESATKEIFGAQEEQLTFAYRFAGEKSGDKDIVQIIDLMLNNSNAGLIDLNLVQNQKALKAGSYFTFLNQYGLHFFYGIPREGQSLDELKDLILGEIEKIKTGNFDEWLVKAVINDLRLRQMKAIENNSRAHFFVNNFISEKNWIDEVKALDELEKITKNDIVEFAKNNYKNYVMVYKRNGVDTSMVLVKKPPITAIAINRENNSQYLTEFAKQNVDKIEPVFVEFDKAITSRKFMRVLDFHYVENTKNEIFTVKYIYEMGKLNNILLPLAINLLPLAGTEEYSPADLQKEFYKLGVELKVSSNDSRSEITLSGLESNFNQALKLLEKLIAKPVIDQATFNSYIEGIITERENAKLKQNNILWQAMYNYGRYGAESSFTNVLSNDSLKNITPLMLTNIIADLSKYKHAIYYYGKINISEIENILAVEHKLSTEMLEIPARKTYIQRDFNENEVFFVNYNASQAEILLVTKDVTFNKELLPNIELFNEFYGSGLSSIVFQELRESRALAYTAFSYFSVPLEPQYEHNIVSYLSTKPDKLEIATNALLDLSNQMPKAEFQFNNSKELIIKKIQSERIQNKDLFKMYQKNADRGIFYDDRKDIYQTMQTITIEEFETFFNEHVAGKKYAFMILGKREDIDFKLLEKMGKVRELSLEEIFNY